MTTTITLLKQLKAQLAGKLQPQRIERKPKEFTGIAVDIDFNLTNTKPRAVLYSLNTEYENYDRFSSYRYKIMPGLQATGYAFFLSCDSKDYQEHTEWCNDHCEDHTLPHCDVWQVSSKYPRAFADKADAAMFKLMFDAENV